MVANDNNERFLALAIDGTLGRGVSSDHGEADTPSQVVAAAPAVLGQPRLPRQVAHAVFPSQAACPDLEPHVNQPPCARLLLLQ
jgi:hypothetical protein